MRQRWGIHVSTGFPVTIGRDVSLGHNCTVHGATIGDDCIIGINSVVLNGSDIGSGSIIGANAFVKEGMKIPKGSVVVGTPGRIIREGDESLLEKIRFNASTYHKMRDDYKAGKYERY